MRLMNAFRDFLAARAKNGVGYDQARLLTRRADIRGAESDIKLREFDEGAVAINETLTRLRDQGALLD